MNAESKDTSRGMKRNKAERLAAYYMRQGMTAEAVKTRNGWTVRTDGTV